MSDAEISPSPYAQSAAERMRAKLRADLLLALRGRRTVETATLRTLIAAIDNAEAIPIDNPHDRYVVRQFGDGTTEAPRRQLSDEAVRAILDRERVNRWHAADAMERGGHKERASLLRAEADIVTRYL